MMADDLHLAEVITWRNDQPPSAAQLPKEPWVRFDGNRYYHLLAGAWHRPGTELLLLNLPAPLRLPSGGAEYPPVLRVSFRGARKGRALGRRQQAFLVGLADAGGGRTGRLDRACP